MSVTYERYLQFFEFHPLRKRLQNTRLKFLRWVLLSPAKLGRALLLGTLDSEKEGRVPTAIRMFSPGRTWDARRMLSSRPRNGGMISRRCGSGRCRVGSPTA